MKLFVMRHGEAEAWAGTDAERALTSFGQRQVRSVADQLGDIVLTGILASPYKRAQQTAVIVRNRVNGPEITTSNLITPDMTPGPAVEMLPEEGSWLLVAHMPLVSRLTGLLVDGSPVQGTSFGTAMVVELEMDFPGAGMASLQQIYSP